MRLDRWTLAAALAALPALAGAVPVTYGFAVTATSGVLAGTSANGTLSFDSSIAPRGGGIVSGTSLLTDLSFSWDGRYYDETYANTGALGFDASGRLLYALFGTACTPGTCGVSSDLRGWDVSLAGKFNYSRGLGDFGVGTFTLQSAPVPEPATGGLAAVGLVLVLGRWVARATGDESGPCYAVTALNKASTSSRG